VDIEIKDATVILRSGPAPDGGADIWLVHYDPRRVEVPVQRGENRGRTLAHRNVVHDLTLIGRWTGEATTLPLPRTETGLRSAVLVQVHRGGPILAAAAD
jgi:hypothetical protein